MATRCGLAVAGDRRFGFLFLLLSLESNGPLTAILLLLFASATLAAGTLWRGRCGQDPEQYRNLRDCFMDEQGEFRSHGANCQVCLEEAEDAAQWRAQGLATKEIRDRVDGKYGGRGKPTDTPPVEE